MDGVLCSKRLTDVSRMTLQFSLVDVRTRRSWPRKPCIFTCLQYIYAFKIIMLRRQNAKVSLLQSTLKSVLAGQLLYFSRGSKAVRMGVHGWHVPAGPTLPEQVFMNERLSRLCFINAGYCFFCDRLSIQTYSVPVADMFWL